MFRPEFAKQFMAIVEYYVDRKITKLRALEALRSFVTKVQDAAEYFEKENAWRISDERQILAMAEEALKANEKVAMKAATGHAKSLSKLRKLLVDRSNKRIEVEDAEKAIAMGLESLKKVQANVS
ncbi:unnamed protein product [Cylicostephanus goldi]|uniref:Asn/Gln amidotransferase domain-containing protein n=1 Tax=Cylicostephanus goldi TaxID=71465 RepID=A0A3P7PXH3_CYLGO|nr:unnamed protein product [Cylicostephanus goldi]